MTLFNQATIIGVGLIGGSLAKSIKKNKLCKRIIGFFRSKEKLNMAIKEKIVDFGYLDLNKSIANSDLIILALPINQIISFMPKIKKVCEDKTVVMDVGSTKLKIINCADKLKLNFVGTHPLAGSEKKGMNFSCSKLFKCSKVLITPTRTTNKKALTKIKSFWKRLNANFVILSPGQHDKILSYISHLPHLSAFSLISAIPNEYLCFGASGLKDSTRIALSDAEIWADIFLSNKKELILSLNSFKRQLNKFETILKKDKRNQLIDMLEKSRSKREMIN